jgi:hypothetical protein
MVNLIGTYLILILLGPTMLFVGYELFFKKSIFNTSSAKINSIIQRHPKTLAVLAGVCGLSGGFFTIILARVVLGL